MKFSYPLGKTKFEYNEEKAKEELKNTYKVEVTRDTRCRDALQNVMSLLEIAQQSHGLGVKIDDRAVVKYVMDNIYEYPEIAREQDLEYGKHIAGECIRCGYYNTAWWIIESFPEVARFQDFYGRTVGHYAVSEFICKKPEVIPFLVKILGNKEAASLKDVYGSSTIVCADCNFRNKIIYYSDKDQRANQKLFKMLEAAIAKAKESEAENERG